MRSFHCCQFKMASKELFELEDGNLEDISEGEEAFIVSNLTDEEREQCNYISKEIAKSVTHGKRSKGFIERVLDVTSRSNLGLPKVFAEHLMQDGTAARGKQGEDELVIPEDPDTPLIIKIIPSSLKLLTIIKQEVKEEVEGEEGKEKEGTEEIHE